MNSILRFLEKRCSRFAIPHLTDALILGQVVVYVLSFGREEVIGNIVLVPELALGGEPWRVVTYLFTPPTASPIFAFFFWYIFFLMGTALERLWGTFRYNAYLLIGVLATVATAFVFPPLHSAPVSNMFLETTVFLAFAFLFPDFEFLIFFLLPVKVKWLALLTWLTLGFYFLVGGWAERAALAASVCNFLFFFGGDIFDRARNKQRRASWERTQVRAKREYRHECKVCGLTDHDDPKMQFRYCPDCDGQCGYCSEHIDDHEHVQAAGK